MKTESYPRQGKLLLMRIWRQSHGFRSLAAQPKILQMFGQPVGQTLNRQVCIHEQLPADKLRLTLVGPQDRGSRLLAATRRGMEGGTQLVQLTVVSTASPPSEAQNIRSCSSNYSPGVASQVMVSRPRRYGFRSNRASSSQDPLLSREARLARGSRNAWLERLGLQNSCSSWYCFWAVDSLDMRITAPGLPVRRQGQQTLAAAGENRYCLRENKTIPPWAKSVKEVIRAETGKNFLGVKATELCLASLAPLSVATYASTLKKSSRSCSEEHLVPSQVQQRDIVQYIAYLSQEDKLKADNLQPYPSSINKFLRDHLQGPIPPVALVMAACKGFNKLQEDLAPAPFRVDLPAMVPLACLERAKLLTGAPAR